MSSSRQAAILAVLLGSLAPCAQFALAQGPVHLTLSDAVHIALKENPQVQNAHLDVADRQQDVNVRRSALLPQASLQVSDKAERINLGSTFGANLPIFPHHVGPFQVFQAGPVFSTPIFDLTLWNKLQSSRKSLAAARTDERALRDQTTLLVVSEYLAALRSGEQLKATRSRVDLAQALFDQAAQLEENGIGTNLDTVRAHVELQSEKQSLLVVQTDRAKALYALAQLLDLDPQQQIDLADQALFASTPEYIAEASVAAAIANRPEVKSLDAQVAAANRDLRAAREERLPSLTLDGNWAYQGMSLESSIPTYWMGVSVNVPLWTSGRLRAEQAKAAVEVHRLENQRRGERDAIAEEVKSAQADLESSRRQVEVARLGLELAQKALDQSRERFASGIANNIEVVTAQDSLARASDNLIDALYCYNLARAQLAHATGQMEADYER